MTQKTIMIQKIISLRLNNQPLPYVSHSDSLPFRKKLNFRFLSTLPMNHLILQCYRDEREKKKSDFIVKHSPTKAEKQENCRIENSFIGNLHNIRLPSLHPFAVMFIFSSIFHAEKEKRLQ
jgi:hypothetical protein